MEEKDLKVAQGLYDTYCKVLEDLGFTFEKKPEDYLAIVRISGKDMPHRVIFRINTQAEVIHLIEYLPFEIDEAYVKEVALAMGYINNTIVTGKVSLTPKNEVLFEMTNFYTESLISKALIEKMLRWFVLIVEDYDDKIAAVNKGYIKAIDAIKKEEPK